MIATKNLLKFFPLMFLFFLLLGLNAYLSAGTQSMRNSDSELNIPSLPSHAVGVEDRRHHSLQQSTPAPNDATARFFELGGLQITTGDLSDIRGTE